MGRMIELDAVVEVLNQLARENFSLADGFQIYLDALQDVETKVKALPSAQQQWIPCSKEMPPKNGRYLVTEKDAFEDIKVRFRYWNTECLWSGWSGDQMDEVLAWCELPKPWEGGQNNG